MIVASILCFSAMLNSFQSQWMRLRLLRSNDQNSAYVSSFIGPPQAGTPAAKDREERYRTFYSTLLRAFADNSFIVRVPFFAISFDVNDLGLIGGFLS